MKFKLVVHEDEEGGYWAEVPALPGCVTPGETMEELVANARKAIEGCLEVLYERELPPPAVLIRRAIRPCACWTSRCEVGLPQVHGPVREGTAGNCAVESCKEGGDHHIALRAMSVLQR